MPFYISKAIKDNLTRLRQKWSDDVMIQPYLGYGNKDKFYCMGRILEDERISVKAKDSSWKNFVNSLKRIESDEIPHQEISFSFQGIEKNIKANSEGFYKIEESLKDFAPKKQFETLEFEIKKGTLPSKYKTNSVKSEGEIFFPSQNAQFGVISDIDDTILKTEVLVGYKLKALYNTLFIGASKRMPITNANTWYRAMHKGTNDNKNPIFYISNSPWNLYKYLSMFIEFNKFPKGPIFLRDFGRRKKDRLQSYTHHKRNEINNILGMYPDLPFVLIGDGGEKDADIYLSIKEKYPDRIKAIFVHRLGDKKHQYRIEKLAKGHEDYFFFISNSNEAMKISKKIGLAI